MKDRYKIQNLTDKTIVEDFPSSIDLDIAAPQIEIQKAPFIADQ